MLLAILILPEPDFISLKNQLEKQYSPIHFFHCIIPI